MGVQPADDTWLTPGMVLLDKYRVETVLGKGGMGIVVRAYHPGLDERVAIKILRDDVADPEAAARFLREAQATAKLRSDHVARVSDVGTTDAGMSYMVMELLEGGDIGQMLDTQTFSPGDAVSLVMQACEALAEAHAIGIVHRDIKPTNLFVITRDDRPHVKVLDFGISKVANGIEGMSLTQTQSMLGTPAYMSPEQMRSARTVDLRSDVWSVGTVLYEMIEGRLPFEAENFSEMVVKVSVDPPTPPEAMPPGLAHVVMRCLAKSADERFASMLELAQALAPFASDVQGAQDTLGRIARYAGVEGGPMRPVSSPALPNASWSGPAPASALSRDTIETTHGLATVSTRRSWTMRAGIAAFVLVGVGIGVVVAGHGNSGGSARQAEVVAAPIANDGSAVIAPVISAGSGSAAPSIADGSGSGSGSAAPSIADGSGSGSGSAAPAVKPALPVITQRPTGKRPGAGKNKTIPHGPTPAKGAANEPIYGKAHPTTATPPPVKGTGHCDGDPYNIRKGC